MKESGFFDGVGQIQVPWQGTSIGVPTFYQDVRMLTAMFMAPLERVRALLPSKRLHPYRPTPWHSVVYIAAYEYRASDLGPYNELMIAIPVSEGRPSPLFAGLLRPPPAEPTGYVWYLPVTTELARSTGVEAAAYPKFLADIQFREERDCENCRLSEAGQHILTLGVRKGQPRPVPRSRMYGINVRAGRLLRVMVISAEREESTSRNQADARLELGGHRISQEQREPPLGRMAACTYTPSMQSILTGILESFPA